MRVFCETSILLANKNMNLTKVSFASWKFLLSFQTDKISDYDIENNIPVKI